MKIQCTGCNTIIEIDDADVRAYLGIKSAGSTLGSIKSEAKTAAAKLNARKPRPGSRGNTRAKKKTQAEP